MNSPTSDLLVFASTTFMSLFAIMNPIANTPVFIGLTAGMPKKSARAVAARGVVLAFVIVAVFALAGRWIFEAFGITLPAFRITGGILVFHVGLHMLRGSDSGVQSHSHDPREEDDIGLSPLAIPILAGPGTIATAMQFVSEANVAQFGVVAASFALLCGITYVMFRHADTLVSRVGPNMISVVSRLMGLILAVVGTQMVLAGVEGSGLLSSLG